MSLSRVLVIDDEPAIRALVAKIVDRAGLPVDTAGDGAEAIEKMEQEHYAVVVVDMMMPRVDGFGVVEYVRSRLSQRPVVIVISASDSAILRQLDGSVVHSIVRKPFEIDVLGDLIAAAAKSYQGHPAQRPEDRAEPPDEGQVVRFLRHK